jgi:nitrite reductase/ring-hydroxylating ferredoxin subunit
MSKRIHIAEKKNLSPDRIFSVKVGSGMIIICQTNGRYFAVSAYCPHENFLLSKGYIVNGCIICPLHGSEFDLQTGKCLRPPATEPLKTYHIVEVGDDIYLELAGQESAEPDLELSTIL